MRSFRISAVSVAFVLAGAVASAQDRMISIATGSHTGVYIVVGQSICRLVNRGSAEHGLRCSAPASPGSITNIETIATGETEMAIVQSDWQFHAVNGTSVFEGRRADDLRAVFSVHSEPFTVLARAGTGISSFEDLFGRRVNVGNPGSGQRATMDVVLAQMGRTSDDFASASELSPADQADALAEDQVDAIVYTAGHPNRSIQEATTSIDAQLVAVTGPAIDALVERNPYFEKATIPGGLYNGNDVDVETFGVQATFVTSAQVPQDVVYAVVKAVFDDFERFRGMHPAFVDLKEAEMVVDGLSAPLHPGAERYYRERGWLE
ncbi:MAG: TAXI family TRAP transporter solute-binding subunit [Pseudomonadota bacterium]